MSQAENIVALYEHGAKAQAQRLADHHSCSLVQDWDGEATVYELFDGSLIYVSGSEFRVGTIADKYINGHLHVTPEDFFYSEHERFELVADGVYEFFDGSRVVIDADGYVKAVD
jgi:hypothetical protein